MQYTSQDFYMLDTAEKSKFLKPIQKPIRKPIKKLRELYFGLMFAWGCIKVIRDPFNTDSVIRSAQGLATPERFADAIQFMKSQEGGVELFRQKPLITALNLERLSLLPSNTLGYAYAQHMKKNGLDPNFFDVKFVDDITYAFYRYGKIHDLLHIVTGFDTTIAGEVGVLSYTYVQNRGPGVILIAALAMLHGVLFKPLELSSYLDSFVKGHAMGKSGRHFFVYDWEAALSRPLSDVKAELNLVD